MCNTGRKLADRFELLCLRPLPFQSPPLRDVTDHGSHYRSVFGLAGLGKRHFEDDMASSSVFANDLDRIPRLNTSGIIAISNGLGAGATEMAMIDRKSTRLNSSH